MAMPIARHLKIPPENVIANRMLWQWDDETQLPTKLVGFDSSEPTSQNQGKPQAIARLRDAFPYQSVGAVTQSMKINELVLRGVSQTIVSEKC
jgi:glycerol-3-phosphate dehydrogenase (NAD+)